MHARGRGLLRDQKFDLDTEARVYQLYYTMERINITPYLLARCGVSTVSEDDIGLASTSFQGMRYVAEEYIRPNHKEVLEAIVCNTRGIDFLVL